MRRGEALAAVVAGPGIARARERGTAAGTWATVVRVGGGHEHEAEDSGCGRLHGEIGADGLAKTQPPSPLSASTESPRRALAKLRSLVQSGELTCGQLALRWGCSRQRAWHLVFRDSGPGDERLADLPERTRRRLEAA